MSDTLKFANPIRVGSLASDPSSPDNGTIYYNTTTGKFRQYADGDWADMGQSETTDALFRIVNDSNPTKEIAFDASGIATATTVTISLTDDADLDLIATAIQSTEKGANNGVATLDGGGKIPVAQLPNAVMTYEGMWDASSNTPTLADGIGNAGQVYRVSAPGTVNFGSGNITFALGDYVIYSGSVWEKSDGSDAVNSVNGQTGIVVLDTDDVSEGATNKYFSPAAAQAAVVIDSIADADTTHAPSRNAVFDALALKLSTVAQDTTPQLGGNLDLNTKTLMGLLHHSASADGANFSEQEYIHSSTLTASATNTVLAALGFAFASFEAIQVTYKIKEASTGRVRVGALRIVTDGTNISMTDTYNETADVGVTWSAVVNGSNIDVRYTTTANNKTMRAQVLRIKT